MKTFIFFGGFSESKDMSNGAPCFGWKVDLVLGCWPSKIKVIGVPGLCSFPNQPHQVSFGNQVVGPCLCQSFHLGQLWRFWWYDLLGAPSMNSSCGFFCWWLPRGGKDTTVIPPHQFFFVWFEDLTKKNGKPTQVFWVVFWLFSLSN